MPDLKTLIQEAEALFASVRDSAALEDAKARYLGKSGSLTEQLKSLGKLPAEERKAAGEQINEAKASIESALQQRREQLAEAKLAEKLKAEALDVTLPGRAASRGGLHPVSISQSRIEQIFHSIGFEVADGPEIESDWFNFTALNSPENHPARSMQDTFYVDGKDTSGKQLLLRTHTSPMQIRHARMHVERYRGQPSMPAIKVIAPGRTYRVDSDATHSPMFHQVEGLWIDRDISFADLKGVFLDFMRTFFEDREINVRFRPSYFPFTEPSAEIDIAFSTGPMKGKWLEVSGSGQVHPQVVRNMGLDPATYIGFAFGCGIERLTMLRYGINDLRLFFDGDMRFLRQFN